MAPEENVPPKVSTSAHKLSKQRLLEQIFSLKSEDDERTSISKKLSWILRHGAKKVQLEITEDGWIKVIDLLKLELLEDVSEEKLMHVVAESNRLKPRYELKDSDGGHVIKAIKRERKALEADPALRKDSGGAEALPREKGELRRDAPEFVPSQLGGYGFLSMMGGSEGAQLGYSPQAMMGYPWSYGGYGFPSQAAPAASPISSWSGIGSPPAFAAPAPPAPEVATPAVERFRGKIRSFNADKGFGFIDSPETNAKFGRNVFLHKTHIGDFAIGSDVTFSVGTNKQGMPQARDLAAIAEGDAQGAGSKGDKAGKGKSGKAKGGDVKGSKGKAEKEDAVEKGKKDGKAERGDKHRAGKGEKSYRVKKVPGKDDEGAVGKEKNAKEKGEEKVAKSGACEERAAEPQQGDTSSSTKDVKEEAVVGERESTTPVEKEEKPVVEEASAAPAAVEPRPAE
eukprot:TRINITY_DN22396_c0_g1_i1.p1 TRINITY_DN22396_c0_g1~~TRINITY_DN22396_c0_g1_i1.p1  ORF type:complete len:474 (-),score=125.90 TRINITY_DN22396_c0_g1_i1:72-1433(-)